VRSRGEPINVAVLVFKKDELSRYNWGYKLAYSGVSSCAVLRYFSGTDGRTA